MPARLPSRDDGVTIRYTPDGVEVWMVKKRPGVYFARPQEGKPLQYVSEDMARAAGFDVTGDLRKRKVEERMAEVRQKLEREVAIEQIKADHWADPPFAVKHRGAGNHTVVLLATGEEQTPDRLTKPQAEELAQLCNEQALKQRLAEAGIVESDEAGTVEGAGVGGGESSDRGGSGGESPPAP